MEYTPWRSWKRTLPKPMARYEAKTFPASSLVRWLAVGERRGPGVRQEFDAKEFSRIESSVQALSEWRHSRLGSASADGLRQASIRRHPIPSASRPSHFPFLENRAVHFPDVPLAGSQMPIRHLSLNQAHPYLPFHPSLTRRRYTPWLAIIPIVSLSFPLPFFLFLSLCPSSYAIESF